MGKFDGVLLASDFDDTLYGLDLRIPERNLEAIRYFTREGGYFVMSTGRAHRTFAPFAPLVPMNAPAVLSNGAAIYDFQADRMLESRISASRKALIFTPMFCAYTSPIC